jgi:hypothetical protein
MLKQAFAIFLPLAALGMFSGQSNYSNIEIKELKPAALQGEAMIADNLRGHPVYHGASRELWLSGAKNIWRWNLETSSVTRYEMPVSAGSPFRILGVTPNEVVGFDEGIIWIFEHSAKKWSALEAKFDAKCPAITSAATGLLDEEAYFIFSRCGIYVFSVKERSVILHRAKSDLDPTNTAVVRADKPGHLAVVFPHRRELVKFIVSGTLASYESLYSAKSEIRGVAGDSDALFAWTHKAVVVFDWSLKRRQVVPVTGQRKIATFGVAKGVHVLTFDDGAVEFMDLASKRKLYSNVRLKHVQNVDFIEHDRYMVVSSSLVSPRVFRVTPGG